jgi:hypothetical protein
MPPVYGVISFLSYRYFRAYTYYSFVEVVYEAITLSAFLLLLIQFVAAHTESQSEQDLLASKKKRKLLVPFCCWRFNPTKGYFLYAVKWSVLQYVIVRPLVSLVGIVCQALNILCESQGFNIHYANVYLEAVDFVSISVALYGLLVFYALTREDLVGRKPLAKFLCIKLIVMFTFYQSFVFSALEGRVIKATKFWTATNIADGLNALAICIEMIIFAALMLWAYPAREYKREKGQKATKIGKPLLDSINYSDFWREIVGSSLYFFNKKAYAKHLQKRTGLEKEATMSTAFNIDDAAVRRRESPQQGRDSESIPLEANSYRH